MGIIWCQTKEIRKGESYDRQERDIYNVASEANSAQAETQAVGAHTSWCAWHFYS